jgi:hypothetical protein
MSLLVPEVGRHESCTYGEELQIVANDNWLPDEKRRQQYETIHTHVTKPLRFCYLCHALMTRDLQKSSKKMFMFFT